MDICILSFRRVGRYKSKGDFSNEQPFDRKGAEQKVTENNLKYLNIKAAIKLVPGISVIPFSKVSDEGVQDNLKMQIEAMCFKEYTIING